MKYRGTITVFLSLILTIILSLIMAVTESAIYHAARMKTEMIADMGMDSVFAEYNRELLSRYDLYFIDTSYGGMTPSLEELKEHLRSYMDHNCSAGKGALLSAGDFTKMTVRSVDILGVSYASDSTGRVFKRQAIEAVRDYYGITALNGIVSGVRQNAEDYKNTGYEETDMDAKEAELKTKLDGYDYKIPENPAANVFDEKAGIMDALLETDGISKKHIEVSSLASHRHLNKGSGIMAPSYDPDSVLNELYFDEYLFEKFSDYIKNDGHNATSYEIEYVLEGENTDIANLKKVVKKLLLVRYAADAAFIMTSSTKKETVEAVVEVIGLILGLPTEASKSLADLILLAWAFGESVSDVVRLLAGEKVPLKKTEEDWKMPLYSLVNIKAAAKPTGSKGTGFSYEDYLKVFLFLMDKNKKVMRAMDVVEMNLRLTEGNHGFRIDGCAEYLDVYAGFTAKGRYEFGIRREQSYMPEF